MSSFSICQLNRTTFTISNRRRSFQDAQQQCRNEGKILLQPLNDNNQYSKLKNCPFFQTNEKYWIGLKNVNSRTCSTNFQRADNSQCVRSYPLYPQTQPINGNECRAVVLHGVDSRNRNLPGSLTFECLNRNYYICQSKRQSTTKVTTTTTAKPTGTAGKPSATTEMSDLPSFIQNTTISKSTSAFKTEILFGALTLCLLIFSILMIFFYRRYGRKKYSKRSCCFQYKSKQLNTFEISERKEKFNIESSYCT